jgi:YegS/Rv2252/BmrU family lipid kinase
MAEPRRIRVIVNPAAGQDLPVLNIFNKVFRECGVDWDIAVTKQAGDAQAFATQLARDGVDIVAAYGGDGTVAEVASGLIGSDVPLAILPGGTANVMSVELGIPTDLAQACAVACNPQSIVRPVDMGLVNEQHFILRVGVGFEAAMVENADRELKNRYGVLAYLWSAMQNLAQPEIARYHLTLDGQSVEVEGLTCIIANSGNLGQAGVNLIPNIDVYDGLLDVIVIEQASLRSLFDLIGTITGLKSVPAGGEPVTLSSSQDQIRQTLHYWQAKEVTLTSSPPQTVQYDGEVLGKVDVRCQVLPQAIRVITPPLSVM